MELAVYFNGQFWVAVLQESNNGVLLAARHVFGPSEPSDPEVYEFVRYLLLSLRSGMQVGVHAAATDHRRINPKRLQRQIRRELATVGQASLVHAAIQAQLAERKRVRCETSKAERAACKERKRLLAREKAKAKHRGQAK